MFIQSQCCQPQRSHPRLHGPLPFLLPLVSPGHSVHPVPSSSLPTSPSFFPRPTPMASQDREMPSTKINPWHTTGTFMFPCSTTVLCNGHIYVPSDLIQYNRFVNKKGFPQITSTYNAIRTPVFTFSFTTQTFKFTGTAPRIVSLQNTACRSQLACTIFQLVKK